MTDGGHAEVLQFSVTRGDDPGRWAAPEGALFDSDFDDGVAGGLAYLKEYLGATAHYARVVPPREGAEPPRVTIYKNRQLWAEDAAKRDAAETYLKIDRGGFEEDGEAVLYFVGDHDTRRLLRHEAFHAWVSVHAVGGRPPAFVEEGLAAWMENPGKPHYVRLDTLAAFDGELPLETFAQVGAAAVVDRPALAQLYYAAAWATADYLMTHRLEAMRGGDWSFDADAVRAHIRTMIEER